MVLVMLVTGRGREIRVMRVGPQVEGRSAKSVEGAMVVSAGELWELAQGVARWTTQSGTVLDQIRVVVKRLVVTLGLVSSVGRPDTSERTVLSFRLDQAG